MFEGTISVSNFYSGKIVFCLTCELWNFPICSDAPRKINSCTDTCLMKCHIIKIDAMAWNDAVFWL